MAKNKLRIQKSYKEILKSLEVISELLFKSKVSHKEIEIFNYTFYNLTSYLNSFSIEKQEVIIKDILKHLKKQNLKIKIVANFLNEFLIQNRSVEKK